MSSGGSIDGGPRKLSPFFVPGSVINMAAGSLAIRHGLKGPNLAMTTACTTATHSIGIAARLIAYGDADVMLAGGSEKASTPLGMGGFAAARALSTRNDDRSGVHCVPITRQRSVLRFPNQQRRLS